MKKLVFILSIGLLYVTANSCVNETCTSSYELLLKIDAKNEANVTIKYIGPDKRNYKNEFRFGQPATTPNFYDRTGNTICSTRDFKNHNYDFLEIKNISTENVYICAVLSGREVERTPSYIRYAKLLDIYANQDKDPAYDYTKDEVLKNVESYMDRYDFYEQLLSEGYPYIIKLEPQKTCVIKWGNLGIKVLE